jgi:cell division protein FtsB
MARTGQADRVSASTRILIGGLLALLFVLQWRLWFSDDGWPEVIRLRQSVTSQQLQNEHLAERNARLQADVADLKSGFTALEERARSDLGMVGKEESFYLFVPADDEQAD